MYSACSMRSAIHGSPSFNMGMGIGNGYQGHNGAALGGIWSRAANKKSLEAGIRGKVFTVMRELKYDV